MKDRMDRRRLYKALDRGLDLSRALWVATAKGKPVVQADAALRRVEEAIRNGSLGVRKRTHLGEAILKHLAGEGFLRVEWDEAKAKGRKRFKGDARFAPWVLYRLTKKGRKLLEPLLAVGSAPAVAGKVEEAGTS